MYGVLIAAPHRDKIGMEHAISHCAGWTWNTATQGEVGPDIMGDGWTQRKGLPARGTLRHALIVRAGFLTDGESVGDKFDAGTAKKNYRVSEKELGGYTISRKDASHFVVDAITRRWDEFDNKRVNLTY
jgi:hypothetical protein